jgi:hypothetical protein
MDPARSPGPSAVSAGWQLKNNSLALETSNRRTAIEQPWDWIISIGE